MLFELAEATETELPFVCELLESELPVLLAPLREKLALMPMLPSPSVPVMPELSNGLFDFLVVVVVTLESMLACGPSVLVTELVDGLEEREVARELEASATPTASFFMPLPARLRRPPILLSAPPPPVLELFTVVVEPPTLLPLRSRLGRLPLSLESLVIVVAVDERGAILITILGRVFLPLERFLIVVVVVEERRLRPLK